VSLSTCLPSKLVPPVRQLAEGDSGTETRLCQLGTTEPLGKSGGKSLVDVTSLEGTVLLWRDASFPSNQAPKKKKNQEFDSNRTSLPHVASEPHRTTTSIEIPPRHAAALFFCPYVSYIVLATAQMVCSSPSKYIHFSYTLATNLPLE